MPPSANVYAPFQPTGESWWNVGPSDPIESCVSGIDVPNGFTCMMSNTNGGLCPASPDGGGCAGRWQEYDGSAWQDAPDLGVQAVQCQHNNPDDSGSDP